MLLEHLVDDTENDLDTTWFLRQTRCVKRLLPLHPPIRCFQRHINCHLGLAMRTSLPHTLVTKTDIEDKFTGDKAG